jgi:hypothetical protein
MISAMRSSIIAQPIAVKSHAAKIKTNPKSFPPKSRVN